MSQTAINHRGMDKELGSVAKYPELAAIIAGILGTARYVALPNGQRVQVKLMAGGDCRAIDYNHHRYVQQNPRKPSKEGARARAGAQIVWIIRTHDKSGKALQPNQWVGKVEDGIVRQK